MAPLSPPYIAQTASAAASRQDTTARTSTSPSSASALGRGPHFDAQRQELEQWLVQSGNFEGQSGSQPAPSSARSSRAKRAGAAPTYEDVQDDEDVRRRLGAQASVVCSTALFVSDLVGAAASDPPHQPYSAGRQDQQNVYSSSQSALTALASASVSHGQQIGTTTTAGHDLVIPSGNPAPVIAPTQIKRAPPTQTIPEEQYVRTSSGRPRVTRKAALAANASTSAALAPDDDDEGNGDGTNDAAYDGRDMGGEKPLLTPAQKRANHIASEQKRRAAIRQGYDALCNAVPSLRAAVEEFELRLIRVKGTKRKRGEENSLGGALAGGIEIGGEKIDGRAGPRSEAVVLGKCNCFRSDRTEGQCRC
jgi:hypothetical protein